MSLYTYLISKTNENGCHIPSYYELEILNLQQSLDEENVTINIETLELLRNTFSSLKYILAVIEALYLPSSYSNPNYIFTPYFDIFFALYIELKDKKIEDIKIDPQLLEVVSVLNQNDITANEKTIDKKIYQYLFHYYWINRYNFSINNLNNLVHDIKYNGRSEIFINNGIMNDSGNSIMDDDDICLFIDCLLKQDNHNPII